MILYKDGRVEGTPEEIARWQELQLERIRKSATTTRWVGDESGVEITVSGNGATKIIGGKITGTGTTTKIYEGNSAEKMDKACNCPYNCQTGTCVNNALKQNE